VRLHQPGELMQTRTNAVNIEGDDFHIAINKSVGQIHEELVSGFVAPMERASVATDGDSRTAMDGPDLKQSCPLEWVSQTFTE
jgi:hypothetical protein